MHILLNSNNVTVTHVILRMQDGKGCSPLRIIGESNAPLADRLMEVLMERCPNALVDYSRENAQEYRAILKSNSSKGTAKKADETASAD